MTQNPFTSSTFESVWSKHFNDDENLLSFNFIKNIKFIKHSKYDVYVNAGRNLTKGVSYNLDYNEQDFKGKTFLIYDVPTYFDVEEFKPSETSNLKRKSVFQYQGVLMDISDYTTHEDYINAQFSSKNRREFRSNKRRLETCFNISYEFIHGELPQERFDNVFKQFHSLLSERFDEKQTNYHHLSEPKWNYYSELVFEMLKEKKASLLVISNENTPIGITLNFHSENVLFETITVFDPDYYKFSIGKTSIIKLLEWCFENNYKISDFSKGDFDYKHKWGNQVYDFNYHVFYDSKSIKSVLTANCIEIYYKLKLFLRKKKVNELYRKSKYLLSGQQSKAKPSHSNFKLSYIEDFESEKYTCINYADKTYDFLPLFVYSFMFANPEPASNIKVYKHHKLETYIIEGSKKTQQINFTD